MPEEYSNEFNLFDNRPFTLEDHGILYLSEDINEEISEYVCREIIRINCQNKQKYVQMIINSPGGFCTSGFAIHFCRRCFCSFASDFDQTWLQRLSPERLVSLDENQRQTCLLI